MSKDSLVVFRTNVNSNCLRNLIWAETDGAGGGGRGPGPAPGNYKLSFISKKKQEMSQTRDQSPPKELVYYKTHLRKVSCNIAQKT